MNFVLKSVGHLVADDASWWFVPAAAADIAPFMPIVD